VLQTIPSFVDTPELALLPHDDIDRVNDFGYEPWSMYFYAERLRAVQILRSAAGDLPAPGGGARPRVVVAHLMGAPGRPLVIQTTTVIVDDNWLITGTY
jgi:hypothetical protein